MKSVIERRDLRQREYLSSKPLKHGIVKLIFVFER